MRTYSDEGRMNILFFINEVVTDVVDKYVKQGVAPSTRCIPEGLQRHESSEGWVKKFNKAIDQVLHNLYLVRYKVNSIAIMEITFLPKRGYFVNFGQARGFYYSQHAGAIKTLFCLVKI